MMPARPHHALPCVHFPAIAAVSLAVVALAAAPTAANADPPVAASALAGAAGASAGPAAGLTQDSLASPPDVNVGVPLPLANTTYLVFDSTVSPPGARGPVTCYRIPMVRRPDGVLAACAWCTDALRTC